MMTLLFRDLPFYFCGAGDGGGGGAGGGKGEIDGVEVGVATSKIFFLAKHSCSDVAKKSILSTDKIAQHSLPS